MINAYQALISHEEDDWQEYLNKICLIDIFMELILNYGHDKQLLKSFIKYIAFAYSKESDKIIIGDDWEENKKRIFEAAGFEPIDSFLQATVYLKDDIVVRAINKWLSFQDNDINAQLKSLQDLQLEMRISSNSAIKKSSGEIDFDQKYKNACYVGDLRKIINNLQDELIQSSPKLKEAYKEVKAGNKKNTKSVESIYASEN
jgi:hypothetical protein